uniref:L27-1 domain-containing protein n=1 Tax=Leptobrachium leishanense TaxID=445787 RepID=A0A8C5P975_9ANUR
TPVKIARALALLEDYCVRFFKPEELHIRQAVEKVIRMFKSDLFKALIGKSQLSLVFRGSSKRYRFICQTP